MWLGYSKLFRLGLDTVLQNCVEEAMGFYLTVTVLGVKMDVDLRRLIMGNFLGFMVRILQFYTLYASVQKYVKHALYIVF